MKESRSTNIIFRYFYFNSEYNSWQVFNFTVYSLTSVHVSLYIYSHIGFNESEHNKELQYFIQKHLDPLDPPSVQVTQTQHMLILLHQKIRTCCYISVLLPVYVWNKLFVFILILWVPSSSSLYLYEDKTHDYVENQPFFKECVLTLE